MTDSETPSWEESRWFAPDHKLVELAKSNQERLTFHALEWTPPDPTDPVKRAKLSMGRNHVELKPMLSNIAHLLMLAPETCINFATFSELLGLPTDYDRRPLQGLLREQIFELRKILEDLVAKMPALEDSDRLYIRTYRSQGYGLTKDPPVKRIR